MPNFSSKKLELVETQPTTGLDSSREEVKLLGAVVGFGLDYCPIEGGMMLDDGALVSREISQHCERSSLASQRLPRSDKGCRPLKPSSKSTA